MNRVVWRGYRARVVIGAVAVGLGLLPYSISALVPAWGSLSFPYASAVNGRPQALVVVLITTVLFAAAMLILPARRPRAVVAALLVIVLVPTSAALTDAVARNQLSDIWTSAVRTIVLGGAVSVAWLIARERPRRSFFAMGIIGLAALLTGTTLQIALAASRQLGSSGFARGPAMAFAQTNGAIILGVVVPIVLTAIAGALLDPAKLQKREIRAAAREQALADAERLAASPETIPSGTNTFAILSIVFSLVGGLLGIVFGHIALAQIKRTPQRGSGLALTGLVIGYLQLAIIVVLLVVATVVAASR